MAFFVMLSGLNWLAAWKVAPFAALIAPLFSIPGLIVGGFEGKSFGNGGGWLSGLFDGKRFGFGCLGILVDGLTFPLFTGARGFPSGFFGVAFFLGGSTTNLTL